MKVSRPTDSALQERLDQEVGVVRKAWGGKIPIALAFPNRYATGMSNLGFHLVYQLLNEEKDLVCERIFLPESDAAVAGGISEKPLSMESQQPLGRFEIVAFSVPFENDYPHLLRMLAAAGIPLEARRRQPPHPLIWVGGVTVSLNPEPLALFVDLFAIGEAEELLPDLMNAYRQCRRRRLRKDESLALLSQVRGVYVPSLYDVRYDRQGRIRAFQPRAPAPRRVERRTTRDLAKIIPSTRVLTHSTEFESLFLVEISRGCPRGCRFCAAGHVFRPTRHRRLEDLRPVILEGLKWRERIGLVSSSVCDHPQINEICREILAQGGKVSVASIRLDALSDGLLTALARGGQRTLSLAPEAGSQRLRDIIRKGISEEQILEASERVARAGIPSIRLYFMVGLPTETLEDVEAIETLVRRILHRARKATRGRGLRRVTLSINPFVPKPSTPFQWHPFMRDRELKARLQHIRRDLRKEPRVHLIYDLPKWSRIQALLSRGDRRLGKLLMLLGRGRTWDEALREVNLNPDFYLYRQRSADEHLPWDFIDHGIPKATLWEAYQAALAS